MKQQIVFTHKFEQSLSDSIAKCNPDKISLCCSIPCYMREQFITIIFFPKESSTSFLLSHKKANQSYREHKEKHYICEQLK